MTELPAYYARGPEALVVSLAAKGDRDAFTELVRRRQSWLRNLMRRFSGDPDLADDLAQRVLLQAWRKIRQLRHPERFGSWIQRIAVNEWIDHQRRDVARWNEEYDDDAHAARGPTEAIAMDLDRALAVLPVPVRLCIVLSYHERMTHEEIARISGISLGTVKSHVRRGSSKLRRLLADYGDAS